MRRLAWPSRWAFVTDVEVEGRRWTGSWGGEHLGESLDKPGVEMGVGSLGETCKSLSPEGTGVWEGALCQGQDGRQPLEVGSVPPDGMSPPSRRRPSGLLSQLGAPFLSLRKEELRGQAAHPADSRRPRIEEAPNSAVALRCPFFHCWVRGRTCPCEQHQGPR